MFFTGLTHPFKAIHHLLATIASQVEPGILFNGHIPIDPPHTECFFPPYFLQNIFFVIGRRNGLSQAFQIFPYKSIRHLSISIGGKIQYWEADGASLRKQMLKAPLKYSRISSKFSYARKHPIYKVYRPHTGVDYAAPKGTPVHAVADGTVTFKGWGGGGGNTLKIKHAGNLMTGYLHLSGYAKGIVKGSRVSQGQLIGYVGSTGASTGPHLDYRVWKNGTPIDPLKIPSEPAEPIARENRALFEFVRDRITAELNGEVSPEEQITQLDSLVLPATVQAPDKQ